jgi:uncharacterized membrane protein YraQ (UPF0718 family)
MGDCHSSHDHKHHHDDACHDTGETHCHDETSSFDWLLWGSGLIVALSLALGLSNFALPFDWMAIFTQSAVELADKMWPGVVIGIFFVGLLELIPREIVIGVLGDKRGLGSILRATGAGVLLDLCSHGILMVAAKLYERGVRLGQVMAFLIASPWNSFSLTLILWGLVGFWWMITFLGLSLVIAIISGLIFDALVDRGVLPDNPNKIVLDEKKPVFKSIWELIKNAKPSPRGFIQMIINGWDGSKMILKWIFFGIVLACAIRAFVPPDMFKTLFGPTLAGLGMTIIFATIMEACSEGSTPIAADIMTRSQAAGNSFAFLMVGVSTDYTEMMVLREATKSWKIALFLPLVTLPQVIILAIVLNQSIVP